MFRRNTLEMNAKLLFLAVGLLAVCVGYVHACSCFPPNLENGCGSDYSLRGRVVWMRYVQGRFGREREYSVFVQRYYKAIPNRPRFVRIRTARNGALCGVQLQIGQRYVISGEWSDPFPPHPLQRYVISGSINGGQLRTHLCAYTRAWNSIPEWQKENMYCHPGALDLPLAAPSIRG